MQKLLWLLNRFDDIFSYINGVRGVYGFFFHPYSSLNFAD